VKRTSSKQWENDIKVDDIIKNGVKEVKSVYLRSCLGVGDAIQSGVKEMKGLGPSEVTEKEINNTIQNGVKDTDYHYHIINEKEIEDTIQSGVKHTMWSNDDDDVEDAIKNGVKEVKERLVESLEQKDHMVTNVIITEDINYAIENGVKE
jgi:uncharacterized membrane protein YheB (UPF0754 family)